jgi:hypothetical protein
MACSVNTCFEAPACAQACRQRRYLTAQGFQETRSSSRGAWAWQSGGNGAGP